MINNRQNGRRRGRGGTRPPNGTNNGPERGNRLDNRARGNANQLHEKYKTLARDAQMQGDRVMTEYYLQFADHYFRVLSESRQRFEEQRRFRGDDASSGDYEDEDDGDGGGFDERGDYRADGGDQDYRQPPRQHEVRPDNRGDNRQDGNRQDGNRQDGGRQDNGSRQEYRGDNRQDARGDGNRQDGRDGNRNEGRGDNRPRDRQQQDQQPRRREPRPNEGRQAEPRQNDQRPAAPAEHERQTDVRPADSFVSEPPAAEQQPAEAHPPVDRPRRPRVRRDRVEPAAADAVEERIEIDRLPPSFTAVAVPAEPATGEATSVGEEGAPRRRRTRRPRAEGAPAEA